MTERCDSFGYVAEPFGEHVGVHVYAGPSRGRRTLRGSLSFTEAEWPDVESVLRQAGAENLRAGNGPTSVSPCASRTRRQEVSATPLPPDQPKGP